ncbi:MAG: FAD:protein FMN transferase [Actinomycetota bacterium]
MTVLGLGSSIEDGSRHVDAVTGRAMGTDVHVIVVGGPSGSALDARAEIDRYEGLWSRFRSDSELSVVNAAAGRPTVVSTATVDAIAYACDAHHETEGVFDPTVLSSMIDAGYDRDFSSLSDDAPGAAAPAPGLSGVTIDRAARTVQLPAGVGLDLGGIAKGLTADLIVAAVLEAGAAGCCVNIGGDLRVGGDAPSGDGWLVDYPLVDGGHGRLTLQDGAVCTSATTKRRWRSALGNEHHIRSPRTGQSLDTDLASLTVVAARAAQADVLTKVGLAAGAAGLERAIGDRGATGRAVTIAGEEIVLIGFDRFHVEAPVRV